MRLRELENEALNLPAHQRARLAEHLLTSLDEPVDPGDVSKAWLAEARQRRQAYRAGTMAAKDAKVALREAQAAIR